MNPATKSTASEFMSVGQPSGLVVELECLCHGFSFRAESWARDYKSVGSSIRVATLTGGAIAD